MLPPLAGHTKRVQDDLARGDYAQLVEKVRHPQSISLLQIGAVEEAMNLVEFFVHHEDVRRATPGWTARDLPEGYEQALLGRVRATTKLSARRFPGEIVAHALGAAGAEPIRAGAGGERVEVHGAPGELLLFFTGRQRAANVEVTGPDELSEKLRGARLGL